MKKNIAVERSMAGWGLGAALAGLALILGLLLASGRAATVEAQAGTGIIRVATTGTDVSGCGSPAQPCRTV